jgi:hypothetical protein
LLPACIKLTAQQTTGTISKLLFRSVYVVPHNLQFKGTTVGGLSGIDVDPETGLYYMISDDRSAINPARFYTARIGIRQDGIDTVMFQNVTALLQPNGKPYPNSKQDPVHTPDPEAMRYNPERQQLVWSSEGERIVKANDTVLENPSVTTIKPNGQFVAAYPLPPNLEMHATEKGPRQNGVLEGMSFADGYQHLWVNVEEPLYEDGPRADLSEKHPYVRFFKFDVATGKNTAQYAYPIDPVAHTPLIPGTFMINGIPDILWLGNNRLLVIERSYSTGRLACTIKLYLADLNGAQDIKGIASLRKNPPKNPVRKKLLLNMDLLGRYIDNVEGVTWGPRLGNGHQSLILIADNNFAPLEKTQVILLEIVP